MTRNRIIIIIAVIIMIGGAFALMEFFAMQKEAPPEQKHKDKARAVRVTEVEYRDIISTVEATGRLGSQHYVDLIAEVQGMVLPGEVSLKKGENFREGELLFRIFHEEIQYTLKASKSRFLNLIANALPDLKIDYPESFPKWKNFFEEIEIDEPLPPMPEIADEQEKTFLASRNILNDYYSIKSSEVRFEKYFVYAPFKGSFSNVMMEVGSVANPGSRVASIIRTDKLELEVPVEVDDVHWIEVGDAVDVYSEDGKNKWKGNVVRESDFVDPATQSVSVFITVQSSKENPLFEGQYLKAVFKGKKIPEAMEIPRRAVFNSNEVFIVKDSILLKEQVKVHKVNQNTLIFSGLEKGVDVVIEPLVNVPEKAKVISIAEKLNYESGRED
ncbi:MAG: efflux RND transporter periplasmic adaptor subunit [Bacteroidales bacterium]|nr:efflux RND transporter periplasmic adaptor subunit [Bacteroidales bacterium]MCF8386991.1 efflux RND transporter periplasmic adaptor subunit [Bacteroidales bacterium]MCF8397836.1 efflux RND transporter periplasmic adaptor subunit [Bacteroidales bacterium]